MKKILIRILPALVIGIALIVSTLIFTRGIHNLAGGLYNISYSIKNITNSTETMYQKIQDFPSFLHVDVTGSLKVSGAIDTY